MDRAEATRHLLRIQRARAKYIRQGIPVMTRAIMLQQSQMMELVQRGEFEAVQYAEVPREPMLEAMQQVYRIIGVPFARNALRQVVKAPFNEEYWSLFFEEYVGSTLGSEISWITHVTRERFISIVQDVIALQPGAGLSQAEMTSMIMERIGIEQAYRARRIVKTEMLTASNMATQQAVKSTGMQLQKVWLSALLPSTRDTHAYLHGTAIPIDGTWDLAGGCQFPGDPALPPEDRINCYCGEVYETIGADAE